MPQQILEFFHILPKHRYSETSCGTGLREYKDFQGFKGFMGILGNWGILRDFKRFLKDFKGVQMITRDFKGFQGIFKNFDGFQGISRYSNGS